MVVSEHDVTGVVDYQKTPQLCSNSQIMTLLKLELCRVRGLTGYRYLGVTEDSMCGTH